MERVWTMRVHWLAFAGLPLACGGTSAAGFDSRDAGETHRDAGAGSEAGAQVGGGNDSGRFGDDGGSPTPGCSGAAKDFVYVITQQGALYSFAPDKKLFTKIGDAQCSNTGFAQYNSMAVDRSATAWVNVIDVSLKTLTMTGSLYRVSTKDAKCEASPSVSLPPDWTQVGMGFSVDMQGGSTETLYVSAIGGGPRLGRIDMGSKTVVPIGAISTGNTPELTGTGDARLYGFFVNSGASYPPSVGQLDKSSAAVTSPVDMMGLQQPNAWAFSFWGGHFYLYTQSSSDTSSRVSDFNPASQAVDLSYMTDVGFTITGAGVSTCAPTQPPQ